MTSNAKLVSSDFLVSDVNSREQSSAMVRWGEDGRYTGNWSRFGKLRETRDLALRFWSRAPVTTRENNMYVNHVADQANPVNESYMLTVLERPYPYRQSH